MTVLIPVVEYVRPHGEKRDQSWGITGTYEDQLQEKLDQLKELGITITAELIPALGVSVCFDDGEDDYTQWLFQNNKDLPFQVMKKVLEFDKEKYQEWKNLRDGE